MTRPAGKSSTRACKYGRDQTTGKCNKAPSKCKYGRDGATGKCNPNPAAPPPKPKPHRKILRDNIQGLNKPAIQRLGYLAGVTRMQGLVYEETRAYAKQYIDELLSKAHAMAENARRKTISAEDVTQALKTLAPRGWVTVYADSKAKLQRCKPLEGGARKSGGTKAGPQTGGVMRPPRAKPGAQAVRKALKYQTYKAGDCVMFPVSSFNRFAREVLQDRASNFRLSTAASNLIQLSTEAYLVKLLRQALETAKHAKRTTVAAKNIQYVGRMTSITTF